METVEKNVQDGPVKIGIGPKDHHEVLRSALGCEDVMTLEQLDAGMEHSLNVFRQDASDVAVFIRPTYVSPAHLKWMATYGVRFQVAGHEPQVLRTWDERKEFMALKAKVGGVEVPDGRGAKRQYEVTASQIDEAIADWHAGDFVKGKWRSDFSLKQIEERLKLRTGQDLKAHWVRDQVKKRFGSAARNPNTKGEG